MAAIYLELKNNLIEKIHTGVYKSGDQIPSERELAEAFGVSRMTARQAINALVAEGMIYREKGRGSFVSTTQFSQKNVRSFTETLKEQGYDPTTKILEFATVHSLKEISQMMNVPYGTSFYKIKRLRLGNNVPIALETVYIPVDKCPNLLTKDFGNSLYDILREQYNYTVEHVSYDIDAAISSRVMMNLFEVQKPVALLKIKGISYVVGGEKLLYEESYYRSDLYRYQVDIYKR